MQNENNVNSLCQFMKICCVNSLRHFNINFILTNIDKHGQTFLGFLKHFNFSLRVDSVREPFIFFMTKIFQIYENTFRINRCLKVKIYTRTLIAKLWKTLPKSHILSNQKPYLSDYLLFKICNFR